MKINILRFMSVGSLSIVGLLILLEIFHSISLYTNPSKKILVAIIYISRIGLIFGAVTFFSIVIFRAYWKGLIASILTITICGFFVSFDWEIRKGARARNEKLKNLTGEYNLLTLRKELVKYAESNSGYLPSADKWCDSLIQNNPKLTKESFLHPNPSVFKLKGNCHFAFNEELSKMILDDIPDDVILVFEADGDWNLSGNQELLKTRYQNHGYISVIYKDGKVRNYWYDKRAVRTFTEDAKVMYYVKPRWK